MWNALKRIIIANPMGIFIYGIITKWYLLVTISALVVVFWVLKGLGQAGVFHAAETIVSKALSESKAVAQYCVPKIANISDFIECVNNPPEYREDENARKLHKALETILPENMYPAHANPYDANPDIPDPSKSN